MGGGSRADLSRIQDQDRARRPEGAVWKNGAVFPEVRGALSGSLVRVPSFGTAWPFSSRNRNSRFMNR